MEVCTTLSLRGESGARDAAIHRVPGVCVRVCLFAYWLPVDRHGLRPRDDKISLNQWPSLGSFGPAGLPPCLGQDSPRSLALLAFLETNTEADEGVTVAGGADVAPSRTQGRPVGVPGTTPSDPIRARCRSGWIHHRIAGRVSRLVPVRGPLPDISVHVKKAPWVGRILPHIAGLFKIASIISTAIPIIIRIRAGNAHPP